MSINRGTLPQNFLDSVSLGMRLPQPEPQYFFAMNAIAASAQATGIQMGLGTADAFAKMMYGGQPVPPVLDKMMRSADAYPGFIMAVNGFGLNQGDTIKMRRPVFDGGGYTEASREVLADKPTSTTGINIAAEEVPVVLKQYEGPFANGGSVVQPYPILDFDAKYKANKDELAGLVRLHLLRDRIKWLDTVIRDRFRACQYITYADDVANVLSFTAGAGHNCSLDLMIAARQTLADRERSPFANGRYIALVPTAFNRQMIGDPDYRALSAQHADGRNSLFGYIGSIQDVDIFEVSTLKTYAAGVTVPNDTNAVPSGATVYEGLIISPNAVGHGVAQSPTCYDADDTDYGKNAKVIWRSTEAFQTLDERGIQRFLFQA